MISSMHKAKPICWYTDTNIELFPPCTLLIITHSKAYKQSLKITKLLILNIL